MNRIILHCDLNNFFASVSLLFNQTLYNCPVAVCGDKEQRHGIVLAKNELAKSFGIKTAETIGEARQKCPDLVILPPMYDKYEEYSHRAREIYYRYTDLIEPFGIDECWLDVTGSTLLFGSGEEIANRIRQDIKDELGITISVGVSFNKTFAKLGSDIKKPDAVTIISRENFPNIVWPLPIQDLLFVGKKTAGKLNSCGVFTIGDITKCNDKMLEKMLGKNGLELKKHALGEDTSLVNNIADKQLPKSIGRSVTGAKDFCNRDEVWETFLILSEDVSKTLHIHRLYAGGIQVHIRTHDLKVKEFSQALNSPTDSSFNIAHLAFEILEKNFMWDIPLRSVGLRAINLKDSLCAIQESLFEDREETNKQEKIEENLHNIRKKFGETSIKRARTVKK